MSKWSIPLDKLAEKAKLDLETVARKAMLQVFAAVVERSPVGNADLWKANAGQARKRDMHNLFVQALNTDLKANRANYTKSGKLKVRLAKEASARTLRKRFPNVAGKGYVGGRFRANWNVSYGAIDYSVTESTDRSKSDAEVSKAATLAIGGTIYMTNSLPYALKLENGYSKQAPIGMVRLSAVEFARAVRKSVR